MKKRLSILLIAALLLSVVLGTLTGCDEIFKLNEERDAQQTVATVGYNGQTATIKKYELESSFNSYAYYYVYYYGMTYEESANYILKSLAQRELLVMFAKEYIANEQLGGASPDACSYFSTREGALNLLSSAEYNQAIKNVNEDLLSSLETEIESLISEDNTNSGSSKDDDDDDTEITKPVKIVFEANGGSDVAAQTIQNGKKAKEPTAPTKDGYTFYGWYDNAALSGEEFDFDSAVVIDNYDSAKVKKKTLYAKWVEYTAPRTEIPAEEEEDDYDPDGVVTEFEPFFFSAEYRAKIDLSDKDYVGDIDADTQTERLAKLGEYIDEALTNIKKNITDGYKSYDYYLENELKSMVTTKLERLIKQKVENELTSDADAFKAKIQAQFDLLVAQNKETFAGSSTSYSSALTSSLATTYFHKYSTQDSSYGFVVNILMKLDDESVKELTGLLDEGYSTSLVKIRRDQLIAQMQIKISNPVYSSTADVVDKDGADLDLRDPMTDPNNPYNDVNENGSHTGVIKNSYYDDWTNDYGNILSFVNDETDGWKIVYNVKEAPFMAYMTAKVPAFGEDGIVEQIYDSFASVTAAVEAGQLSKAEGIYWLREIADAWLYIVGDDSGAVSTDSNNGGLGYLVSPEGEESSFLEDFTVHARALVKKGGGSYTTADAGASRAEKIAGSYVIADSFINEDYSSASASSAYAGVFVLLVSNTVWDASAPVYEDLNGNPISQSSAGAYMNSDTGILPWNYIMTYGKTDEDMVTIYDKIKEDLISGIASDRYNLEVNTFGVKHTEDGIQYFEKAFKSLWKDLD
jgi:uncharacterized repeat protein (TIGR02543 family)